MTYRYNVPSSGGTFTAATLQSGCEMESFLTDGGDASYRSIISNLEFQNNNIVYTAVANPTILERSGTVKLTYRIGNGLCETNLYFVQSGS